ncbi:MAG: pilin [Candidatus Andersenbacteria bacterium]
MSSFVRTCAFVTAVATLSLAVFPVSAQLPATVTVPGSNLSTGTLLEAIQNVVNVLLTLVGIVAVVMIIYGGVRYIISLGDEAEAAKAKRVILYALIGLIVIGLSAVIVNFVLSAIMGGNAGGP